jgi:hypothetical protein
VTEAAVCMSDAPDFPMWRAFTSDLVSCAGTATRERTRRGTARRISGGGRRRSSGGSRPVLVYSDNDAEATGCTTR